MAWSVSEFFNSAVRSWRILIEERALDRRAWEEARKGMTYVEKAIEQDEPITESVIENPAVPLLFELFRYVGIAVLIVALVVLIVYLVKRFSGAPRAGIEKLSEPEEEELTVLTPIDKLWKAFEAARARGDYREAMRLLYQIAIRQLDLKGALIAHPDKTNWEYVRELSDPSLSRSFASLTILFERNWYGDRQMSQDDFAIAEPGFMEFINKPSTR